MPNEDKVKDRNASGANGSKNPFADSNWLYQNDRQAAADGIIDFGVNSAKRVSDPITKARNMPMRMPDHSFRDTSDLDERKREREQAQAAAAQDILAAASTPATQGIPGMPGMPPEVAYRMRMPDSITPPAPPPGGAVSAWSAMVQNMKMAQDSSPRTVRITPSQNDIPRAAQGTESFQSSPLMQFPPLSPPAQPTQAAFPAQSFQPFTVPAAPAAPAAEAAPTHTPERRIVAYAGLYALSEGAYSDIIMDGSDKLVKLPGFDRAAGADISFPNAIIVRHTGVYLVNYEMNIRSAEDAGTVALSLLINGKPTRGHVHETLLNDMRDTRGTREINPTEQTAADAQGVALPVAPPNEGAGNAEPEESMVSGPARMSWHGFMELQSGDHLSLRVSSARAGRLRMDSGRHTFINIILLEPLNAINARPSDTDAAVSDDVSVPPPPA